MKLPIITTTILATLLAGCVNTSNRQNWTDNGMFQQELVYAQSIEQFAQKQSTVENAKRFTATARHGEITVHALPVDRYWVDALYEKSMKAINTQLEEACKAHGGEISYDDYWDNLVNGNIRLEHAGLSNTDLTEYKQHDKMMRSLLTNPPVHTLQNRRFKLLSPQSIQNDKGEIKDATHLEYNGKQSALCIKEQQVVSAFTIGKLILFDDESHYPAIAVFPAFNSLGAADLRRIEVTSVEYWDSYMSDEIEKSNEKKKKAERKKTEFTRQQNSHKDAWANRLNNTYTRGDKVCTYSNRIGFIDDINGDNYRIMLKKELAGADGKFFGKWPFYSFEDDYTYTSRYKKLDETVWMQKSDFAHCTIDL